MKKSKALRLAGFAGALCTAGALLGTSVASTGAYFTDSRDGSIASNSGHLTLSGVGQTNLNFAELMPGTDQSATVPYTVNVSSGKVDVWMVFDTTSSQYGHFSGTFGKDYGGYTDGGMGRYGHFQVGDDHGVAFRSHNLQMPASGVNCADGTAPDANGDGGSDIADLSGPSASAECGVPGAILVTAGLTDGATGHVNVVFGLSAKQTQQNQTEWTVPYKLVATQAGQRPTS